MYPLGACSGTGPYHTADCVPSEFTLQTVRYQDGNCTVEESNTTAIVSRVNTCNPLAGSTHLLVECTSNSTTVVTYVFSDSVCLERSHQVSTALDQCEATGTGDFLSVHCVRQPVSPTPTASASSPASPTPSRELARVHISVFSDPQCQGFLSERVIELDVCSDNTPGSMRAVCEGGSAYLRLFSDKECTNLYQVTTYTAGVCTSQTTGTYTFVECFATASKTLSSSPTWSLTATPSATVSLTSSNSPTPSPSVFIPTHGSFVRANLALDGLTHENYTSTTVRGTVVVGIAGLVSRSTGDIRLLWMNPFPEGTWADVLVDVVVPSGGLGEMGAVESAITEPGALLQALNSALHAGLGLQLRSTVVLSITTVLNGEVVSTSPTRTPSVSSSPSTSAAGPTSGGGSGGSGQSDVLWVVLGVLVALTVLVGGVLVCCWRSPLPEATEVPLEEMGARSVVGASHVAIPPPVAGASVGSKGQDEAELPEVDEPPRPAHGRKAGEAASVAQPLQPS